MYTAPSIIPEMHFNTFKQFDYLRPDLNLIEKSFRKILETFYSAKTFDECENAIERINVLRSEFDSMYSIAMIRFNINTADPYYANEAHYYDTNIPIYQNLVLEYYKALKASPFKENIKDKWGLSLFHHVESAILSNHPAILDDLKTENKLSSQYNKLIASAKINFNGEENNIAGMLAFEQEQDRAMRKNASEAKWQFFSNNSVKLDDLYHQLVQTRHKTARKLGFNNFIELAYTRYLRTDYSQANVSVFREQIKAKVVPIVSEINKKRAERLRIDKIKYYDSAIFFKTGNAKLKGDDDCLLNNAETMFSQFAPEMDMFFKFMRNKELMDLISRKNKSFRGYCTWINQHKSPFIFANFNGTSNDVRILVHELGHAFQKYHSKHHQLPEYSRPTFEACEIHSMSLEFLSWPWMNLFFEEDSIKYQYSHICGALTLLTYCAAIDEFQHVVYAEPGLSSLERKKEWKKIEQKYLPYHDYDDNDFLNAGGYWQQQSHIFTKPFYYIDYGLAQICALQFWNRSRNDFNNAWQDYLKICKVGGSMSFAEILNLAALKSPFEEDCLETTLQPVVQWLDNVSDSDLG
jgi:M3 family oligoendopeptidase